MVYNFKRAIGIGFCLYLATFIVGIICGAIYGKDMSSATMTSMPDTYWYVGMGAAVILTYLFTRWYFKNPTIVPSAQSGFWFGLTAAVLAFGLDYILFSLGNMGLSNEEKFDLGAYYSDYRFWIIVVLVILTAKLTGHLKKSK